MEENDVVKKLNKVMSKVPNMKWGALTNAYPTNAKIKELNKMLPHDHEWHTLFEEQDQVHIDGVTVRRKNVDSMT